MTKVRESLVLLLITALCFGTAIGFNEEQEQWKRETESSSRKEWFLLKDKEDVVKTEAGEMKVVRSPPSRILDKPMHIGFITMEPKSLFVPQYMDAAVVLFVPRGEAKLGLIDKDEPAETRMKSGDVYRIPAGSVFYLVNVGEGQRLEIICGIDTAESSGFGTFQSFFIAGGGDLGSVLAGFDPDTMATAFNVTYAELRTILTKQRRGPIIYVGDEKEDGSVWRKFVEVKDEEIREEFAEEKDKKRWWWRKLLKGCIFGEEKGENNKKRRRTKSGESYNIYEATPGFRNEYGWSVAVDESAYPPLGESDIGVYLVNLTAGAMMAPHVNPRAAEYGYCLKGCGRILIEFPNGTSAMDAEVCEGDVFWIPRYFPFSQIASRTGPFEFFGFTTSARKNRPQFLAGATSILQALRGPELAAAFGVKQEVLERLIGAQTQSIILPSAEVAPPHKEERERRRERDWRSVEDVMKSLENNNMVIGL